MLVFFRKLLTDETAFLRSCRALLAAASQVVPHLVGAPEWVGPVLLGAAVFLGAGDKNPKPVS